MRSPFNTSSSLGRQDWPFGIDDLDAAYNSALLRRSSSLGARQARAQQRRRSFGNSVFIGLLLCSCTLLIGGALSRYHKEGVHQAVQAAHRWGCRHSCAGSAGQERDWQAGA